LLFAFGVAFSRNEQMTEAAWERKWVPFQTRYAAGEQFNFTIEDLQSLSRLIQTVTGLVSRYRPSSNLGRRRYNIGSLA
jgi:hypothetical protein